MCIVRGCISSPCRHGYRRGTQNVREHYNIPVLRSLGERLVRDARSFDSLASIFLTIDGLLSIQMQAELSVVREERNRVTHGTMCGHRVIAVGSQVHP